MSDLDRLAEVERLRTERDACPTVRAAKGAP